MVYAKDDTSALWAIFSNHFLERSMGICLHLLVRKLLYPVKNISFWFLNEHMYASESFMIIEGISLCLFYWKAGWEIIFPLSKSFNYVKVEEGTSMINVVEFHSSMEKLYTFFHSITETQSMQYIYMFITLKYQANIKSSNRSQNKLMSVDKGCVCVLYPSSLSILFING